MYTISDYERSKGIIVLFFMYEDFILLSNNNILVTIMGVGYL